jgi:RNA polymerase sigma factor (sigma-70 family)
MPASILHSWRQFKHGVRPPRVTASNNSRVSARLRDYFDSQLRIPDMMNTSGNVCRKFNVLGELPSLRRYARTLTRSDIDAEDLVHDALVRAYEKRGSFRAGADLRVWLLSIMHNIFIDGTRARGAGAQRLKRVGELIDQELPPAQDHHVRLRQIRQAFIELPEEQRAALCLIAIEGLSYSEAAAALGIPVGTLMSRIARARNALRAVDDPAPSASAGRNLRLVGG